MTKIKHLSLLLTIELLYYMIVDKLENTSFNTKTDQYKIKFIYRLNKKKK